MAPTEQQNLLQYLLFRKQFLITTCTCMYIYLEFVFQVLDLLLSHTKSVFKFCSL